MDKKPRKSLEPDTHVFLELPAWVADVEVVYGTGSIGVRLAVQTIPGPIFDESFIESMKTNLGYAKAERVLDDVAEEVFKAVTIGGIR